MKYLNRLSHKNDLILNGIKASNTQTKLKMKMDYIYELFCYLCNFTHPKKTGLKIVNEEEQIFIESKTDWNTDNHNGKESKFCFLRKYKTIQM